MLVLTRKQNEKIRIGESIVITVVRMKGKAVRLGIEAPSDMNILRGELVFDTNSEEANPESAEVCSEEPAQTPAVSKPKAKRVLAGPERNPASDWSGKSRSERTVNGPSAVMDSGIIHHSIELASSFTS